VFGRTSSPGPADSRTVARGMMIRAVAIIRMTIPRTGTSGIVGIGVPGTLLRTLIRHTISGLRLHCRPGVCSIEIRSSHRFAKGPMIPPEQTVTLVLAHLGQASQAGRRRCGWGMIVLVETAPT